MLPLPLLLLLLLLSLLILESLASLLDGLLCVLLAMLAPVLLESPVVVSFLSPSRFQISTAPIAIATIANPIPAPTLKDLWGAGLGGGYGWLLLVVSTLDA